jgi:ribonucleotide reductase class II
MSPANKSKDIVKKIESKFKVQKRGGGSEDFKVSKVHSAIKRALVNGGGWNPDEAEKEAENITNAVISLIVKTLTSPVNVESIQNLVIQQLWAFNRDTEATHYTVYKEERKKSRELVPVDEKIKAMIADDAKNFDEPIQYFQLITKFARWNEKANRRETWQEVCDRVIGWFQKQPRLKNVEESQWNELFSYLYNLKASPAMRVVQMAGAPLDRCNVGVFNCSYLPIVDLFSFVELLYILMQGTGAGFSVESANIEHLPRIKRQKLAEKTKHIIEDSTEGWCDALHMGLKAWFEGDDIDFDFSRIRPAGAKLKTKGGRSCGPEPLKDLLKFARDLILKRQGKYLTELDCHDLACMVGKIVQVGGVRRAALISLSDLSSSEMREAKSGAWWQNHVHRSMANNSAVYDSKPSDVAFMDEWLSLAKSGSGERGIFNRDGVLKMLPKRRKKAKFGTNPCFHPDTRIFCSEGLMRIVDLYELGMEVNVTVDNREKPGEIVVGVDLKAASQVELTQTQAKVFRLTTEHGHEIVCTENHEFPTAKGRKQLKDLKAGDTLCLQSDEGFFGPYGDYKTGVLLGVVAGAGKVETNDRRLKTLSIEDFLSDMDNMDMVDDCLTAVGKRGNKHKTANVRTQPKMSGMVFTNRVAEMAYLSDTSEMKTSIPETVMRGKRSMVAGYLSAVMSSASRVISTRENDAQSFMMQIDSPSKSFLLGLQMLFANFGVVARVAKRSGKTNNIGMLRDVNPSNDDKVSLILNRTNCAIAYERIGVSGLPGSILSDFLGNTKTWMADRDEKYVTKVKEIRPDGFSDVYCLNQPETHNVIANGVVAGNCAEIILRPHEFCNLTIVIARPNDTAETLKEKIRIATIFGTMQASCTNFKYIRNEWHKNCEEEALLGVDITGQMDCPLLRPDAEGREKLLEELKGVVAKTNEEWAKKIGINRAAADTCVKPSGDSSQFYNCGSGIHAWFGKFFVRRVRERRDSPVARMLMDQGVPWMVAPEDPSLVCFEFPRKAPEGALTRHDQTAIDQLENWLVWKKHFAEHSVSATIYVEDGEWLEAGLWVHKHFDEVSGVSFLPRDNGTYTGTPYEEITEEEYNKRLAALPEIDWSKLVRYETEDMTVGSQTYACTAGGCDF